MVENLDIFYRKDLNCFGLTVNAILTRALGSVDFLWNQAGMVSYNNKDTVVFSHLYREISNHLNKCGKILTYNFKFSDQQELVKHMEEKLNCGHTLMVNADVYELPFSLCYQDKHINHYFEIIKIHGDKVYICDHYYKYAGEVSLHIILQAMASLAALHESSNQDQWFNFTYFDVSRFEVPHRKQFILETIYNNTLINRGEKPFPVWVPIGEEKRIGVEAFYEFIHYLKTIVIEEERELNQIYWNIRRFYDSRTHYSNILRSYSDICPDYAQLAEKYRSISQTSQIAANKVLKIAENKDPKMRTLRKSDYPGLENLLHKVIRSEEEAIRWIENHIDLSSYNHDHYNHKP
ncbi:hypothetical protein [Paenibacillus beijingensis]|uniref:Butirosin biosynthesis protein H N-terminal domain-containing protein n=1 Tax=Paenibacillus beijingensis TaxID=1126833 RepID=A0A0D5NQC5_9BACL|nr:hypothetical protein [Paenibacillus beijingensis]AJY73314.1 hypothetical protein VN24_00060 [Paenibacillus beijingensis]AJY77380.1 hypothetical protein VN24_26035 [Paenibacillus beijingensis]